MRVSVNGTLPIGVTAKDIALAVIAKIGTAGGTGYVIEYAGDAVRALSMEGRMTLCNMTIEGGARAGLIAPDEIDLRLCRGPSARAQGRPRSKPPALLAHAEIRRGREIRCRRSRSMPLDIPPMVTWGTSPEQALPITGRVPDPAAIADAQPARRRRARARPIWI